MNEELDSQLSAMFDDALAAGECELLARRLSRDELLKARWGRYAVIGAAIRAERGVRLTAALAGRVNAALLAEPELRAAASAPRAGLQWWQGVAGAAVAAGVAAVSIFWLRGQTPLAPAAAQLSGAAVQLAPVAAAGIRQVNNGSAPDSYVTPRAPAVRAMIVPTTELANYVVAHSMVSSPMTRRNLLSAFMTSDPNAPGIDEPQDDAKSNAPSERLVAAGLALALAGAACEQVRAQQAQAQPPAPQQKSAPEATPAQKTSPELTPAQWLERMNQALTTRNYDGTFSHWQGGRVEMLRIVHRVQDGTVSERLASLDGSGREFIRTGSSLACYLPDKRTVVVERRPVEESLVGFPAVDAQTAAFYDIRELARMRLNRRNTHVISVSPKDEYRYGYRLWIDDSTGMPLKTQLCDAHGHVIEQMVFASLTLNAHLPDSAFRPEVATEGFTWLRNDKPSPVAAAAMLGWHAQQLPPGFRMTVQSAQTLPGASGPVDHLVFSDGVASVSVFVEQLSRSGGVNGEVVAQSATVGSSSAFSTVVDGHKVTAVGEVPPDTVRFIASQVQAQEPDPGLAGRHR